VLLPTLAGAVHAAATPLLISMQIGFNGCRLASTGWSGGKAKGETKIAETTKETKSRRKMR
jgi:hypothetical protein